MRKLDTAIKAALAGDRSTGRGVGDFADSTSAIKKAQNVLHLATNTDFDLAKTAVISLGGADGTEIEYILLHSDISKGIIIELDDDLASLARGKIQELQKSGKELKVFTGDVGNKLTPALGQVDRWYSNGNVSSLIVTIHALLHELPTRSRKTTDLESFLARFIHRNIPILFVVREPCVSRDLPPIVYLCAKCDPQLLCQLALKIKNAHPYFFEESEPLALSDSVRMSSRLAAETIVKVFYLDSFSYELEEVIMSFTRDKLLDVFRRVFGTDKIRHTDLQSDSFDKFWDMHGFKLKDEDLKELSKPQLHISIEAKWSPDSGLDEAQAMQEENKYATGRKKQGKAPLEEHEERLLSDRPVLGAKDIDLPDIFTPGINMEIIHNALSSFLGKEQSKLILAISEAGIKAVEDGDFAQQTSLGKKLIEVAGDLPEFHASGLHFAAEGYRLLADVTKDESQKRYYMEIATEYYKDAIGIAPNAASARRGLGRIREIEGKYDEAMRLFEAAQGYAIAGFAAGRTLQKAPALAHEILRASRHRIHCILGMLSSNPQSTWHREVKHTELIGEIAKSDDYHQRYVKLFRSNPRWMYIESFMAMVFLARAWGYVGDNKKSEHYFLEALYARRKLLDPKTHFSIVEISNLQWWIENIYSTHGLSASFMEKVEQISTLLSSRSSLLQILRIIDNLVEPISASRKIVSS